MVRVKAVNNQRLFEVCIYVSMKDPGQANLKILWSVRVNCMLLVHFLEDETYALKDSIRRALTASQDFHYFALCLDLLQVLTSTEVSKTKSY